MKLLFALLHANPELRATIPEIQEDAWMNQAVDINNYRWEEVIRDTEFHANNAGDIFREENEPRTEPLKDNTNNHEIKIQKFYSPEVNDENKPLEPASTFNSKLAALSQTSQLAVLSKSF